MVYGKTGGQNSLHFFRYINDLLFQQCDLPFSKSCTYGIMDKIGIGSHFIERCMNHTRGLEVDDFNSYLRTQLHDGKDLTLQDIPLLKVGGQLYEGELSTAAIFRSVCAAYPPGRQPVACDFCKDCKDVRYCLWFLQCDGTTFDMYAAQRLNGGGNSNHGSDGGGSGGNNNDNGNVGTPSPAPATSSSQPPASDNNNNQSGNGNNNAGAATATSSPSSPVAVTSAPVTVLPPPPPPRPTSNNAQKQQEEVNHDELAEDALIHGILVGLAIGLVVTGIYGCRDYQAKLVLHEISMDDEYINKPDNKELDGVVDENDDNLVVHQRYRDERRTSSPNNSFFHNSFVPADLSVEQDLPVPGDDGAAVPHGVLT